MTLVGWIFMITSWTVIIGLFVFCMSRILSSGQQKNDVEKNDIVEK